MNNRVKIGIVGSGNIAQNAHIDAYLNDERVELVGVCDINETRAIEVKEKYNMKYADTDYEKFFKRDDIDAISVCTWNQSHAKICVAAAKAKKHILCEKPIAMTAKEAEEIKEAVLENGVVFVMGFTRRYLDQSKVIVDLLNKDAFGKIYYANVKELRRRGTPLGWFTDIDKSGGGPVIDIGVHSIYTTWYMMGKPKPVAVSAKVHYEIGDYKTKMVSRWEAFDTDDLKYTVEDSAEGMIRFENGAVMIFENSWAINGEGSSMNVRLYGQKGGATLDPFKIYQEQEGYLLDATPYITKKTNLFHNEIEHFIDCILKEALPITTIDDGVVIQKILDAIYESSKCNMEIRL